MTAGERGFLLLSSHLGDPERKILSAAQFRELARRVSADTSKKDMRQMEPADLIRLGYSREMALHILNLLDQEDLLDAYLRKGAHLGCRVLTRLSPEYPQILRATLGPDAPVCLWYKGDLSILEGSKLSLVGNRDLRPANEAFAAEAGRQAAVQDFTLVSGNARGSDRIAQNSCLRTGGQIIRVLADELSSHSERERVLSLSEDSFDIPFSPLRALRRNRIIHALSPAVLVAQCDETRGGTWDGTQKNLRQGWSSVYCFREDTEGIRSLVQMGAETVEMSRLSDLPQLCRREPNLFAY